MRRLILALILLAAPATAQTEYECYSEGFEADMGGWDDQFTHSGGSVTRTNVGAEVHSGSWALKFVTPSDQMYRRASIVHQKSTWHFDRPVFVEFWVKVEAGTDDFGVEIAFEGWGAGSGLDETHLAGIQYQQNLSNPGYGQKGWDYWDNSEGGAYEYFDGGGEEFTRDVWHHVKFARHSGDEKYSYAEIDEENFDLSALEYERIPEQQENRYLALSILVWSSGDTVYPAITAYIDDVRWGSVGTPCGSAGAM